MRASLLVVLVACSAAPPKSEPPSNTGGETAPHAPVATIARTACFGWCPVYKLTVYRDGTVEYEGEQYVKTQGKATGHLEPDRIGALDTLFTSHGYLGFASSYEDYSVTDMPSVETSYTPAGGTTKTVRHYLGDGHAPKALGEVEDGIDKIVNIEQWIGTEDERQKLANHQLAP